MADERFTVWRERILREKIIDPLRMGMSQEEVMATFGPPDEVTTEKKGRPLIFKYEDIEFHFDPTRGHALWLVYSDEGGRVKLSIPEFRPNATQRKILDAISD